MTECIFCKIVAGDIPSKKIYEDEGVVAFNDIHPIAPVHFMLVPKLHVASLADCEPAHGALLAHMLLLAPKLALEQGLESGFRIMINTGRGGGQEVFHLHVHVFGGATVLPKI